MPYRKRGGRYYRKGKSYSLKQVQAIHINKARKKGRGGLLKIRTRIARGQMRVV